MQKTRKPMIGREVSMRETGLMADRGEGEGSAFERSIIQ